jgi:hypothetical protein
VIFRFLDKRPVEMQKSILDIPATEIVIPPERTESDCVFELNGLLRSYGFSTHLEATVNHPSGKSLRVDLLAIRNGIIIAFEVKAPEFKLAWALRQARDYVLSQSFFGMVLACFVYPAPDMRTVDRYWLGMAKLASYDRVEIAFNRGDGLVLDFGGHVIFRRGQWTSQAKRFLLGQRQLGGGRSNKWRSGRFVRRM